MNPPCRCDQVDPALCIAETHPFLLAPLFPAMKEIPA